MLKKACSKHNNCSFNSSFTHVSLFVHMTTESTWAPKMIVFTRYWNAFPWKHPIAFWLEFNWSVSWVQLKIGHHCFTKWLVKRATSHYMNKCRYSSSIHICVAMPQCVTRPTLECRKPLGHLRSINRNMVIHFANQSQTCQLFKMLKNIFSFKHFMKRNCEVVQSIPGWTDTENQYRLSRASYTDIYI